MMDTKFNTDLFKLLVLPGMRMIGAVYKLADEGEKQKIEGCIRRNYRTFCTFPWTTPNDLVDLLLGNVAESLKRMAETVDYKLTCRSNRTYPDRQFLNDKKVRSEIKDSPRIATRLIKTMYGCKCLLHNKPLNRSHLAE